MKCRMLFLLLLGLLLGSATFASMREIEGNTISIHEEHWAEKGHRCISSIPIITQEGNLIRIYSDIDLSNLQICVKDASGSIVYLDTVFVSADQSYSFVLAEMQVEDSNYIVKLTHQEKYIFGYLF